MAYDCNFTCLCFGSAGSEPEHQSGPRIQTWKVCVWVHFAQCILLGIVCQIIRFCGLTVHPVLCFLNHNKGSHRVVLKRNYIRWFNAKCQYCIIKTIHTHQKLDPDASIPIRSGSARSLKVDPIHCKWLFQRNSKWPSLEINIKVKSQQISSIHE